MIISFENPLLVPKMGRFSPLAPSKNFIILAFTFLSEVALGLVKEETEIPLYRHSVIQA